MYSIFSQHSKSQVNKPQCSRIAACVFESYDNTLPLTAQSNQPICVPHHHALLGLADHGIKALPAGTNAFSSHTSACLSVCLTRPVQVHLRCVHNQTLVSSVLLVLQPFFLHVAVVHVLQACCLAGQLPTTAVLYAPIPLLCLSICR